MSVLLVLDLFASTISLFMYLGSLVESNVSIDFRTFTLPSIASFVGLRLESQFAVFFSHLLVLNSLESANVSLHVVWMEKNVDDVNLASVFEQLLSSLFGHSLGCLGDRWLVGWFRLGSFVGVTVCSLFLLKSVYFQIFETLLKRGVFPMS